MRGQVGTERRFALVVGAVLLMWLLLGVACQGGGGGGTAVELRDFEYRPNQLTARTGQAVTLSFRNTGTQLHDLNVDELDVHSPVVNPNQSATFTFTPSRAGTFQFYCNQPGHREAGMVGTLTVS